MKCLNHQDIDAVAVCMGCGMALCPNCARRSPDDRFVCSDECATRVSQFQSRMREGVERTARGNIVAGWYALAIGAVCLVLGLLMGLGAHDWGSATFFVLVGPIGVAAGISLLIVAKRAPNRTVERAARPSP